MFLTPDPASKMAANNLDAANYETLLNCVIQKVYINKRAEFRGHVGD